MGRWVKPEGRGGQRGASLSPIAIAGCAVDPSAGGWGELLGCRDRWGPRCGPRGPGDAVEPAPGSPQDISLGLCFGVTQWGGGWPLAGKVSGKTRVGTWAASVVPQPPARAWEPTTSCGCFPVLSPWGIWVCCPACPALILLSTVVTSCARVCRAAPGAAPGLPARSPNGTHKLVCIRLRAQVAAGGAGGGHPARMGLEHGCWGSSVGSGWWLERCRALPCCARRGVPLLFPSAGPLSTPVPFLQSIPMYPCTVSNSGAEKRKHSTAFPEGSFLEPSSGTVASQYMSQGASAGEGQSAQAMVPCSSTQHIVGLPSGPQPVHSGSVFNPSHYPNTTSSQQSVLSQYGGRKILVCSVDNCYCSSVSNHSGHQPYPRSGHFPWTVSSQEYSHPLPPAPAVPQSLPGLAVREWIDASQQHGRQDFYRVYGQPSAKHYVTS